jgi:hypothetical protein
LRTDNLLAGKLVLPFEGRLLEIVLVQSRSALWKTFRRRRTQLRIGPKLFGFIQEPVFTLMPESCSRSSRNAVPKTSDAVEKLPRKNQLCGQQL